MGATTTVPSLSRFALGRPCGALPLLRADTRRLRLPGCCQPGSVPQPVTVLPTTTIDEDARLRDYRRNSAVLGAQNAKDSRKDEAFD
jgi:hypothetical protein